MNHIYHHRSHAWFCIVLGIVLFFAVTNELLFRLFVVWAAIVLVNRGLRMLGYPRISDIVFSGLDRLL